MNLACRVRFTAAATRCDPRQAGDSGMRRWLTMLAGEPHAFHVMFWRRNALRCRRASFEDLDRLLPLDAAAAEWGPR